MTAPARAVPQKTQDLKQFEPLIKSFNPTDYLMDLKGKSYLPVAARIAWLNAEFPKLFSMEIVRHDESQWVEPNPRGKPGEVRTVRECYTRVRITFPNGHFVEGSKSETSTDFGDYREKAETGAIGRALALAGYGTLQAPEFDESATLSRAAGIDGVRIVDTPQDLDKARERAAAQKEAALSALPVSSSNTSPSASSSVVIQPSGTGSAPAPASPSPSLPGPVLPGPVLPDPAVHQLLVDRLLTLVATAATTSEHCSKQVNNALLAASQGNGVARAGLLPDGELEKLLVTVQELITASTPEISSSN